MAQTALKYNSAADTTLYDDRTPSEGRDFKLPQSTLNQQDYTRFIQKEFAASGIIQKNSIYTKLEIISIVEKDGHISAYGIKGTGPEAMKTEIVRILKLLPKYTPGTIDGKAARFRLRQPFEFNY